MFIYIPDSSITDFNNTFFNFINDAHIVNKLCVDLGDFNIDLLPEILPPCSESSITDFSSLHFIPAITLPTRVANEACTLIENICFN